MAATLAPPRRTPSVAPAVVGASAAAAVAALYWIGAGRAYGYDAAFSVRAFIATGSLLDPFRRQFLYNNHVLFSFLDHLVYTATGSASEKTLRVLPVLAVAAAVGLVAAAAARRLGRLPAAAAAAVIAVNPILSANARDARGYGLLLLFCVASTLLLMRVRREPSRATTGAYVAALAAAIATHLFGLAMLPLHATVVGARDARRWLPRWGAAAVLGLLPYAGVARATFHLRGAYVAALVALAAFSVAAMLVARRKPTRRIKLEPGTAALAAAAGLVALLAAILLGGSGFKVGSPINVLTSLLGGYRLAAAALLLPVAAGVALLHREHRWVPAALAVIAAIVVLFWLAAPRYLAPRFFVWLLPAVGWAIAVAVARWRPLALVVLAVAAAVAVKTVPHYGDAEVANRAAAQLAARAGGTACAFPASARAIAVYDPRIRVVRETDPPRGCAQLLLVAPWLEHAPPAWRAALPRTRALPADQPGTLRTPR